MFTAENKTQHNYVFFMRFYSFRITQKQESRRAHGTAVRVEVEPLIEIPFYHIHGLIGSLELHTYHISDSFYLIYQERYQAAHHYQLSNSAIFLFLHHNWIWLFKLP